MVGTRSRKIAILLPSLNGGGAERVALFLAEVLTGAGYGVDLVVAVNKGALSDDPVALRHLVDLKAPNEMLSAPGIARYYRRARPDLVIAFCHSAKIMAGLARILAPQMPLALSVHAALDIPKANRFWVRRWFGHGLERRLYQDVRGCHVVSAALRDQVIRHFGMALDQVSTIYNPLPDRGPAVPLPPEHAAWFDRPVLVTAGRLATQKDHASLICAFAQSGLAGRARLLILGEGPLEAMLRQLCVSAGVMDHVIFGGFQPDVRPYLARSSGFLLSSRFEGFAIVLAEALSAGLPVAAMDCPSGPREVLEDGRLGRLIPPGDVAGLAQGMQDIVSGQLAAAASEEIAASLARFAPDTIARQYLAFVESCVGRRHGARSGAHHFG